MACLMRFVVDASIAVKWLVEEEYSDAADGLLDESHELFAPRLMASRRSEMRCGERHVWER